MPLGPRGGRGIDTVWEKIEFSLTILYAVEIILKFLVKGYVKFFRRKRNVFDLFVIGAAIFATFWVYVFYPDDPSLVIRYILMTRALRLVRYLQPFQTVCRVAADVLRRAINVMLLLFCIAYLFANIGMQAFGGVITRDPSLPRTARIENSEFGGARYWGNNFNDMFGSFNVLFNLLVVNNWNEFESGLDAATDSRWPRLYFLFFYLFGVVLANNLVIAFVINAFIKEWSVHANQEVATFGIGKSVAEDAVVIEDSDDAPNHLTASEHPGTNTTLAGRYVAKLERLNLDEDTESSEILKGFFSRSSHASHAEGNP